MHLTTTVLSTTSALSGHALLMEAFIFFLMQMLMLLFLEFQLHRMLLLELGVMSLQVDLDTIILFVKEQFNKLSS